MPLNNIRIFHRPSEHLFSCLIGMKMTANNRQLLHRLFASIHSCTKLSLRGFSQGKDDTSRSVDLGVRCPWLSATSTRSSNASGILLSQGAPRAHFDRGPGRPLGRLGIAHIGPVHRIIDQQFYPHYYWTHTVSLSNLFNLLSLFSLYTKDLRY